MRDDDAIRRLREENPVPNDSLGAGLEPARREEIRRLAMARGEAGSAEPRSRRRALRLAGAVAAMATVIAGGAAILVNPGPNAPVGAPTAEAALTRLAGEAASGDDPSLAPGQFFYTRTVGDGAAIVQDPDGDLVIAEGSRKTVVTELWRGRDGTAWSSDDGSPPRLAVPRESPFVQFPGSGETLSYEQLQDLPTDPVELDRVLRSNLEDGGGIDSSLWNFIIDVLQRPMPGEVRAAIMEVGARIDGVEFEQGVQTPDGRTVTAFGLSEGVFRYEVLLDPETGDYAGVTYTLLSDGRRLFTVSVERGVVDEVGERP